MGVDLGGLERRVAEDLLDRSEIGAVLEHERGHAVAEQVARALFVDSSSLQVTFDSFGQDAFV